VLAVFVKYILFFIDLKSLVILLIGPSSGLDYVVCVVRKPVLFFGSSNIKNWLVDLGFMIRTDAYKDRDIAQSSLFSF